MTIPISVKISAAEPDRLADAKGKVAVLMTAEGGMDPLARRVNKLTKGALQRLAVDAQSDELAGHARLPDAPQRRLADELRFHVRVDQAVHAELVGVCAAIGVGVIREHPPLDSTDSGGMPGFQAKRYSCSHDLFP